MMQILSSAEKYSSLACVKGTQMKRSTKNLPMVTTRGSFVSLFDDGSIPKGKVKVKIRTQMHPEPFCLFLVISCGFCFNNFIVSLFYRPDNSSILIYLAQPPSNHLGALQSFDVRDINPDCQIGGPKCLAAAIPNCAKKCEISANLYDKKRSKAHFFQPDETNNLIPLPYPDTHFRIIYGHEPLHRTKIAYFNESFISNFNVAFHWASGADVPVNFYYFDEKFGRFPKSWWKKPLFGREGFDLSSFSYNKGLGNVSLVYSNGYSKMRNSFVHKFKTIIRTRSFGTFEWNSNFSNPLNNSDIYGKQMQKMAEISKYPFSLVIESAENESGWVTEKIYEAFAAGTVPIYWGPNEVFKMAPKNSFIYVKLANLSKVVSLVNSLLDDNEAYMEYHKWRNDTKSEKLFDHLVRYGRSTAACRLCTYLHKKTNENMFPSPLAMTNHGWVHTLLNHKKA